MQNFVAWWVKNPVAANLLMLGIIISGWLGLKNIEKEAFPSVNPALVQVEVAWQGASPQELEQQVIQRIEDALETVANVSVSMRRLAKVLALWPWRHTPM